MALSNTFFPAQKVVELAATRFASGALLTVTVTPADVTAQPEALVTITLYTPEEVAG